MHVQPLIFQNPPPQNGFVPSAARIKKCPLFSKKVHIFQKKSTFFKKGPHFSKKVHIFQKKVHIFHLGPPQSFLRCYPPAHLQFPNNISKEITIMCYSYICSYVLYGFVVCGWHGMYVVYAWCFLAHR